MNFIGYPQAERFYSDDSNFGVYTFYTFDDIPEYTNATPSAFESDSADFSKRKYSILAGAMQRLYLGSEYKVEAELVYNKKYHSYQYKPVMVMAVAPKTEEQQRMFLQSIITENQTNTILSAYPNIVEEVVNKTDSVDVSKLKNINAPTWARIKENIINNYVISDILIMLQPLGVTFNMIKKLVQSEPNPSLLKEQLIDNPYIMTRIRGLGFKRVDDLALKLNPDLRSSTKRTYAFIKFHLNGVAESNGHTWVTIDELAQAAKENISGCEESFKKVIESERKSEIMLHFYRDRVALLKYYELEMNIFDILVTLNRIESDAFNDLDITGGIQDAEDQQGFTYTDEQRQIIEKSVNSNVTIICGNAGTGKTSISRGIIDIYKRASKSIACVALSAKAAQRITEATGNPSSTIHRLLGWNGSAFLHDHDNPLPFDVIFVDEGSMINSQVFYSLLVAVKEGARVIICGDNRQLPPIGCGNIFSDLLEKTKYFNVNRLTKVLRQAEKSGILSDANKIREGVNPIQSPEVKIVTGELQDMVYMFRDSKEALRDIAIKTYLKAVETDGIENVVIEVPRKQNCTNSTAEINKIILHALFDGKEEMISYGDKQYCVGAKVIQRENNYDKHVFNGEIGYISEINKAEGKDHPANIHVEYLTSADLTGSTKDVVYSMSELSQLDLAYALTCHLMQGSGYKTVIAVIDSTHYILLDSCLLYTALTRAKQRCLLLAEPKAFIRCINTNKSTVRQTWLKDAEAEEDDFP